jgi:hypothetical protein
MESFLFLLLSSYWMMELTCLVCSGEPEDQKEKSVLKVAVLEGPKQVT